MSKLAEVFFFSFLFCSTRDGTQNPEHARHADLYSQPLAKALDDANFILSLQDLGKGTLDSDSEIISISLKSNQESPVVGRKA